MQTRRIGPFEIYPLGLGAMLGPLATWKLRRLG